MLERKLQKNNRIEVQTNTGSVIAEKLTTDLPGINIYLKKRYFVNGEMKSLKFIAKNTSKRCVMHYEH